LTVKAWAWAGQYLIAMVLAAMLGSILGGMQLFRETGIGTTGLTASNLVRFLAYGSAVVLFWLLGRTAARQIPEDGKGLSSARQVVEPLVTLIVVIVGHGVLLLLVGPFLGETGRTVYNWIFVLGIVGAALWMVWAGYRSSAWWIEELETVRRPGTSIPSGVLSTCSQCGAAVRAGMKFCSQCGQGLAAPRCGQCGHSLTTGEKFCGACGQPAG
jgi:TRAP-type C4-dicarboxylate transport system permease small subunit